MWGRLLQRENQILILVTGKKLNGKQKQIHKQYKHDF